MCRQRNLLNRQARLAFSLWLRQRPRGRLANRNDRFGNARGGGTRGLQRISPAFKCQARSVSLHHVRGDFCGLLFQLLNRYQHCCTADRSGAATKGADAVLHDSGVAMDDGDIIQIHTEFIRGDLRE